MSDPVAVEEMTQEQYNEARVAGEVDETGHSVESDADELNDEPEVYVKPEGEAKPEGQPTEQPKRPWTAKEGEDGTQGGIPNARWAANRVALKTKDQELEEARAQIAAMQSRIPQEQEITDPSQIDKAKFVKEDGSFDGDGYLAARDEVVTRNLERRFEEKQRVETHQREVATLVNNYATAVQEEAKTNPEIIDAVRHLDQFGPAMHPAVATMLMKLPPAVSFEVACNEEYIAQLVNGNPVESIALLGELKAQVKARGSQPVPAAKGPAPVAAFKPSGAPAQVKHVPKVVGGGGTGRKDPEQETQDEYNRRRLREVRG